MILMNHVLRQMKAKMASNFHTIQCVALKILPILTSESCKYPRLTFNINNEIQNISVSNPYTVQPASSMHYSLFFKQQLMLRERQYVSYPWMLLFQKSPHVNEHAMYALASTISIAVECRTKPSQILT
jgi:hypothetical protein